LRYAIISDIHSNLEAFEAVLEKIDSLDVDEIICLGDVVGYNANPNECIDIIKHRRIKCIIGNHDSRAIGIEEPTDFNTHAKDAIYWTRDYLTRENITFLKDLPRKIYFDNGKSIGIHGSIDSTDRYILTFNDVFDNFNLMRSEQGQPIICFFGHTHAPKVYRCTEYDIIAMLAEEVRLEDNNLYLINPGAVGQPRDGNPMSSFLVYDVGEMMVNFFRVGYDIDRCCEKIIKAELPEYLAERLKHGC